MRFVFSIITILCVIAGSERGGNAQLRPISSRNTLNAIHAFGKAGAGVEIQASSVIVDARMPSGRRDRGELVVLFDTASGFFQWLFATSVADNPAESAYQAGFARGQMTAYVDQDGLSVFGTSTAPPHLAVRQSRTRAQNVNDAEAQSLQDASGRLADYERGDHADWSMISLLPLGMEFVTPSQRPVRTPIKILQVVKQDGNWEVIIQSQWKEKIILNDKFELIGMTRMD
jgi:hypothetical protein